MNLCKFVKTTSLALAGVTMFTGVAMAFPAISKTALNVRSGPSTGYRVVDALYSGERVNVERCTKSRSWCYVTHNGPDGWVAAKYLKRTNRSGNNGGNHGNSDPSFSFQFGSDGNFSFSFGNRRPTPELTGKACFIRNQTIADAASVLKKAKVFAACVTVGTIPSALCEFMAMFTSQRVSTLATGDCAELLTAASRALGPVLITKSHQSKSIRLWR